MNEKILVVAAHPDDEVLGCGASIRRFVREGAEAHILILGEGLTSRQVNRDPELLKGEMSLLHSEAGAAAKNIDATSVNVLDFPDNRFDTVPLLEIAKVIEEYKRELQPTIIFTHFAHDLNVDHQRTFDAVLTATRPTQEETVHTVYSFEIPSSTEWKFGSGQNVFAPNIYISVEAEDIEAKIAAMGSYSSERRESPHPRSSESIRALARWRGSNITKEYAEAYQLVRRVI